MTDLSPLRTAIRADHRADEHDLITRLAGDWAPSPEARVRASARATALVEALRADTAPGLMEAFLAAYGLSTEEGVALMCLAEALLRVPDGETIDALIEDKIAPSQWGRHLGRSSSALVNASTWALMLTGKVLDDPGDGVAGVLRGAVKRLGEPVIRVAVQQAMAELGRQFVLGRDIDEALRRAARQEKAGFTYSYDMLGEAAMTAADADAYFKSYADAIRALANQARAADVRQNPGISIKLSALHPRYEALQRPRVMAELVPRARQLVRAACASGIGLNIDAEEADRLDLSLDVIEALVCDPELAGWDGFGVVVQAYGKRAAATIDWLYALAETHDRRIMVRLVKGAYWDTEIKRAQVDGVADYPVFTRKAATDTAFVCCARQLLSHTDRIYPQFATHNAHTIAAILEEGADPATYEFQRLHGMGEALHKQILAREGTACRIYAPVGAHRDLLAYLVRRLLENGANSSFVNQVLDAGVPAAEIAADPFAAIARDGANIHLPRPPDLFAPKRVNAKGWDLLDPDDRSAFEAARAPFAHAHWRAAPRIAGPVMGAAPATMINPADPSDVYGTITDAAAADVDTALSAARPWDAPAHQRATVLGRAADLLEDHHGEIFAILAREAGKTGADAVSELREAVDFLRYYAAERGGLGDAAPRGLITCISPWNFPLAIFTGQIAAALAAGNGVLAKPAEPTPIIAFLATGLLHDAGVPKTALQLLPGPGGVIGAALSSDPRIDGVCFTGSTQTAQSIHRAMAQNLTPDALLIAETGGLNAMIVDSTALPEQAVRDIVASAFQSAGQRCSALRMLYIQEDVAEPILEMLVGAMDALVLGAPWRLETDLGPVITPAAKAQIEAYIAGRAQAGAVLKRLSVQNAGNFVAPTLIRVSGIADLDREVFGPVLHVATFQAEDLSDVIAAINASGYGLTFGMHSRIDNRVEEAVSSVRAGNLYINRNQIGAVVASQPFGGEGMSGTGPKAGGPRYVAAFTRPQTRSGETQLAPPARREDVQAQIDAATHPQGLTALGDMPGPTGESNRLYVAPRGIILCLGPTAQDAAEQARQARAVGCVAIAVAPGATGIAALDGALDLAALGDLAGFHGAAFWGSATDQSRARRALAARDGPIIPLMTEADITPRCQVERHVCIDTTAAGGNVSLMVAADQNSTAPALGDQKQPASVA